MDQISCDVINNSTIQVTVSFVLEEEKDMTSTPVRVFRNIRLLNSAAAGFAHGSEPEETCGLNRD